MRTSRRTLVALAAILAAYGAAWVAARPVADGVVGHAPARGRDLTFDL